MFDGIGVGDTKQSDPSGESGKRASSKKKAKVVKRQSSKPTFYNIEGISNDSDGLRIVTWNVKERL